MTWVKEPRRNLSSLYAPGTRFCKTLSINTVLQGRVRPQEIVAVGVALDLLDRAAGEFGHQLVEAAA